MNNFPSSNPNTDFGAGSSNTSMMMTVLSANYDASRSDLCCAERLNGWVPSAGEWLAFANNIGRVGMGPLVGEYWTSSPTGGSSAYVMANGVLQSIYLYYSYSVLLSTSF